MNLELPLIISQILAFLGMLWILKRFAWGPILKTLEARRQKIKAEFDAIAEQKEEIAELNADYAARLKSIEEEARARIHEAIEEGRKLSQQIQEEAKQKAQQILQKAREDVQNEIAKGQVQLKDNIIEMV